MSYLERYHIELFRDQNLQLLQDRANSYLEECAELGVAVEDAKLRWLDNEYHLMILLWIPGKEECPVSRPPRKPVVTTAPAPGL